MADEPPRSVSASGEKPEDFKVQKEYFWLLEGSLSAEQRNFLCSYVPGVEETMRELEEEEKGSTGGHQA